MGPKNEAVTCANVPAKELSWIDRMYQKLENMCVEVDKNPSLLLQETSKYVESQMNVVGTNVKKLCAELIQDLLPPPILSSEGADKKPECAIHFKCDCVDPEKPKQKNPNKTEKTIDGGHTKAGMEDVQAKGMNTHVLEFEEVNTHLSEFEEEGGSFGNIEPHKKVMGATKVEERKIEVATQQHETSKEADFEGLTSKPKVNGEEHSISIGQGAMEGEEKKIEQPQETGKGAELEEQVIKSKESGRQSEMSGEEHNYNCGQVEDHNGNTEEEGVIDVEEKTIEVAVQQWACEREAESEGHTSRFKEGESEELGIRVGQIDAHKENTAEGVTEVEERSMEAKMQQQESEAVSRLKDRAKSCMEMYAFDCDTQQPVKDTEIALNEEMDGDAKSMYSSVCSAEDTEVAGGKQRDEVGGDPESMYSYVFSELSGSSKEEDPMMTSGYLIEEEYEDEQSAHWFVSEDYRNIFQAENFSFPSPFVESPQTRRQVEEFDSDWELL